MEDFGAFLGATGLDALALAQGGVELESIGDGPWVRLATMSFEK